MRYKSHFQGIPTTNWWSRFGSANGLLMAAGWPLAAKTTQFVTFEMLNIDRIIIQLSTKICNSFFSHDDGDNTRWFSGSSTRRLWPVDTAERLRVIGWWIQKKPIFFWHCVISAMALLTFLGARIQLDLLYVAQTIVRRSTKSSVLTY